VTAPTLSPLGDALRSLLPALNAELANCAGPAEFQRAAEVLRQGLAARGYLLAEADTLRRAEALLRGIGRPWAAVVAEALHDASDGCPPFMRPAFRR